jgi:16S rRNA processing protein RimM
VPADSFVGITVARVVRPRGRRGEVAAEILTDFPERVSQLREVWLWDGHNAPRRVAVRACWLSNSHGGQAIFHFDGCDSIEDAERLRGLEVQIPLAERMPLRPGSYYIDDLQGCVVWELRPGARAPERLGVVREVQLHRGSALLVVDTALGELLIPLAAEICTRIDISSRRIEVVLPEGLRELNR